MKHKLKPLKEINGKVYSVSSVCVVDGRNFLDTMRHEHMCFSIIPKERKQEIEEVPTEVADLLKEFPDIVSDNVLDGLPLVQKIIHGMDLIPGANFPNKAAHKMTPKKGEELNR